VLDPFCGSGSTLIAAESAGMAGRALELDPGYCDVVLARWEQLTGEAATLSP
jgi:DNA modification methylase